MKDVAYYLARGFDRPMAEYFAAGRRRIVSVSPMADGVLLLTFDNGEIRTYDCKPHIMQGTVFAPLSDPLCFDRVYLDETGCVSWDIDPTLDSRIHWNNKVDLSPDCCYVGSVPFTQTAG